MKLMVWSAISSLYLLLPGSYAVAQSAAVQRIDCQLSAERPRTEDSSTDNTQSPRVLLAEDLEAMCQLNGQEPRTDDGAIATDDNPSPEHFSIPSLWWQQQVVGEAINSRLIDSWRAYGNTNLDSGASIQTEGSTPHVDIIVNGQLWPLLNYLERYSLINQFGESTKDYGYQLRVFTGNRLVGLHVCDFSDRNAATNEATYTPQCVVELNYFGQGAIRGRRQL
ncbi:hypothetical protein [Adonisia turfae]|nr:hypothetical protein [Adonisia turfae]